MPAAMACHYEELQFRSQGDLTTRPASLPYPDTAPAGHLVRFLTAPDGRSADRALEVVISQLQGRVRSYLRRKFYEPKHQAWVEDAEDVFVETMSELSAEFWKLRAGKGEPIRDLTRYALSVARRRYAEHMRHTDPVRANLARRVTHALDVNGDDIGRWKVTRNSLAGYERWQTAGTALRQGSMAALLDTPERVLRMYPEAGHSADIRVLLRALFDLLEGPVPLSALTSLVLAVQGTRKLYRVTEAALFDSEFGDETDSPLERLKDGGANTEEEAMRSAIRGALGEALRMLWAEIEVLPERQRMALLLNFAGTVYVEEGCPTWTTGPDPDGYAENALLLFRYAGISWERMIHSLGTGLDQFYRMWARLPLEDEEIARLLRLDDAQAVRNSRRSARERLSRKLAHYPDLAALVHSVGMSPSRKPSSSNRGEDS